MACNYRHLGALSKARHQLNASKNAIDKLPKSIWVILLMCRMKEIEALMDYLEEEYKNE